MTRTETNNWVEINKHYLMAALASVREALERHVSHAENRTKANVYSHNPSHTAQKALKESADALTVPSTLDYLCNAFGLSPFERDILLMCAGTELDSTFASLCASAQGDPSRTYPTFSLALAALPEAHWSALTANAPLRRWSLIEVKPAGILTKSPLYIDENVLHYLTGVPQLNVRLTGIVEPVHAATDLVPSHRRLAEQLVQAWSKPAGVSPCPVIQLCGDETAGKQAIASSVCTELGLKLSRIDAHALPNISGDLANLIRLWEREAILNQGALLLDCEAIDFNDPARKHIIHWLVERMRGVLILTTRERFHTIHRPIVTFDVSRPTPHEQYAVWQRTLGVPADKLNGQLKTLVSHFSLSEPAIRSISTEALARLGSDGFKHHTMSKELGDVLWNSCRVQTRPSLDHLAQRIEPIATWNDIVLPEAQKQILKEIAIHVRHRSRVYEDWGFSDKSVRGLGISALFSGESGTGKTMAAEVIANELHLDLYRIDLSQVVSKYIGETEKNLRRVFDAAENGGAILLFDEADALFGKRSEVKDSHDRYANIEISYLLQRMESYRGLAILTTNMRSALDHAFLRRIRFIVKFPFPDAAMRAEIWRGIFPSSTPTNGLNIQKLARLNITGGNIHNIALKAAFLAAEAEEPVQMTHLLHASYSEYAKLEKSLSTAEIGGWV